MRNLSYLITSTVFLLICIGLQSQAGQPGTASSVNKGEGVKYIAYYFHGSSRCNTCKSVEKFTQEMIKEDFSSYAKDGSLVFLSVDLDEDENEHFIDEFNLESSSLILVKYVDGKPTDWTNLEEIWDVAKDKKTFVTYAIKETKKFLNKDA
jgi:hypothetical protein